MSNGLPGLRPSSIAELTRSAASFDAVDDDIFQIFGRLCRW
jgi:hypothetical protein